MLLALAGPGLEIGGREARERAGRNCLTLSRGRGKVRAEPCYGGGGALGVKGLQRLGLPVDPLQQTPEPARMRVAAPDAGRT